MVTLEQSAYAVADGLDQGSCSSGTIDGFEVTESGFDLKVGECTLAVSNEEWRSWGWERTVPYIGLQVMIVREGAFIDSIRQK